MVDNARGAVGQPASHETPSDMVMGERVTIEERYREVLGQLCGVTWDMPLGLWVIWSDTVGTYWSHFGVHIPFPRDAA